LRFHFILFNSCRFEHALRGDRIIGTPGQVWGRLIFVCFKQFCLLIYNCMRAEAKDTTHRALVEDLYINALTNTTAPRAMRRIITFSSHRLRNR